MAHFKSQKELLNAIETNLNKLEEGRLSLSEIEQHLDLVRELYERSIVLRYKAFEQMAQRDVVPTPEVPETEPEKEEAPEPVFEEPETTEHPAIDFSLFDTDDSDLEEPSAPEVMASPSEQPAPASEKSTPATTVHAVADASPASSGSTPADFDKRFAEIKQALTGQLGFDKLDTLVGSFGLNERLQYINELFDGSSDAFSEAVKLLDNQPDIETAKAKAAQFSASNSWDLESDTVEEFMQKLCRRYV